MSRDLEAVASLRVFISVYDENMSGIEEKKDIRSPSANSLFSSGVDAMRGCTSLARLVRASRHTMENLPIEVYGKNKEQKQSISDMHRSTPSRPGPVQGTRCSPS